MAKKVQEKSIAGKELWTAGRDVPECPGKFRWCSTKLRDFFKKNLLWKNGRADKKNACVFLDTTAIDGPTLVATSCDQKKFFACEVIFQYFLNHKTDNTLKIKIKGWPNLKGDLTGAVQECLTLSFVTKSISTQNK